MKTITIQGSTPSLKNSKRIIHINRRPRIIPSTFFEAWAQRAIWDLKVSDLVGHDWAYPVKVSFHFYRRDRRKFDYINLAQGPLDLLVSAGILVDDDMKHVIPGDFSWEVDKTNPRCDLKIEEIHHE